MLNARVLQDAAEAIRQRGEAYGDPLTCFSTIAELWTAIGFSRGGATVRPVDVALAMILLKVARQAHACCYDGFVDIAGYSACAEALEAL